MRDAGVFSVCGMLEAVPGICKLDIGANDIHNDGARVLANSLEGVYLFNRFSDMFGTPC